MVLCFCCCEDETCACPLSKHGESPLTSCSFFSYTHTHRFVVATCLPPLLPTVFTVSVGISENRLSRKRIACSNSEDILVAGKVTRAFFDKTGTLTKQGLDFISAKSHDTWKMESPDVSEELSLGMASCHGLSQSQAGDLIGNPVDRIMFEASGAAFNGTQGGSVMVTDRFQQQVSVVKHFDFDHHSMTQSVILKRADGSLIAYVKGSGESVKKICLPSSLPDDFDQVVRDSAKSGVYQISMASKVISSDGEGVDLSIMRRTEVESELNFIGVSSNRWP
jgi:magnesium-transporting ATPase (P-type)